MRTMKEKLKLNNAGLTLVEIIVAIAIMSVAIIPLMYAFVNAARNNTRGRELQQTTVLANTIIENCKAYSAEEIMNQMSPTGMFIDGVTTYASSGTNPINNTYYMAGVKLENMMYDVEMKLSPHMVNGTPSNVMMMYSPSMNGYKDAIFTADESQSNEEISAGVPFTAVGLDNIAYTAAIQKIQVMLQNEIDGVFSTNPSFFYGVHPTIEFDAVEEDMDKETSGFRMLREITITANQDPTTGIETVQVVYEYFYYYTSDVYSHSYTLVNPSTGEVHTYSTPADLPDADNPGSLGSYSFDIYNNTNTKVGGAELEKIYFCYYPAYSSKIAAVDIMKETITINNNTANSVDVYLIKQKDNSYENTKLDILEKNYYPTITGTGSEIKLYHNFNTNLSNGKKGSESGLAGANMTGVTAEPVTSTMTMIEQKSTQLMFDVEVSIYEYGSYDSGTNSIKPGAYKILTMDSSALNW